MLTRAEILEQVTRYEAYLSRGLYKALHERARTPSRLVDKSNCLVLDNEIV